jgi:hypothetical protein
MICFSLDHSKILPELDFLAIGANCFLPNEISRNDMNMCNYFEKY